MLDTTVNQFADITRTIQQAVMAVTVQMCKGASRCCRFRHDLVHRRSFLNTKRVSIPKRLRMVAIFKCGKAGPGPTSRYSNQDRPTQSGLA